MSITPEPPLKTCEGRLKHGSILNGNIWLSRVSSQWKSTDPFLIVLDEPNSNLDADGERALASAIKAVRARGGIVLLVAHRHGILEDVDYLLVLERGAAKAFGPRTGVLRAMRQEASSRRPQEGASPLALEEQDA
jgi:ABC-type multidrug transport system ATPase subunit